uniref:Uncharacterized protein n=1 Tax=Trypanosoma vivax (strain Y486) TaxID=1055687 RepID=G0U2E4_TRYVY|nr:conserved hypothetical protein, fragment [Trypanosoma vivax Y486]
MCLLRFFASMMPAIVLMFVTLVPIWSRGASAWFSSPPRPAAQQQSDGGTTASKRGSSAQRQSFTSFSGRSQSSGPVARLLDQVEAKGRVSQCWKTALDTLKEGCASLRADDGERSRLALSMAACDDEADGRRRTWPVCVNDDNVRDCIYRLDDSLYLVYVQYRLHADVLCLYIQEEAFQERTEVAVQALYSGSTAAAEALEALRVSSSELRSSVSEAAEQQTSNLAETRQIHAQLQDIRKGQAAAFEALESMLRKWCAPSMMPRQISSTFRSVAQEAEAFQSRTERHIAGLTNGLERVEAFLQTLLDGTMSVGEILRGGTLLVAIVLLTLPVRTNGARLPCVGLAITAYSTRPLLATILRDSISGGTFFVFLGTAEIALLTAYACAYQSPDQVLRQLLRKEVRSALDEVWGRQLEDVRQILNEVIMSSLVSLSEVDGGSLYQEEVAILPNLDTEVHTPPKALTPQRAGRTRSRVRRT